jgi:hypothetical protein
MLTAQTELSAKTGTKLGLATALAALCMTAVPPVPRSRRQADPNQCGARGGHSRVQRLGLTIFATGLGQYRNLSVSHLYGLT